MGTAVRSALATMLMITGMASASSLGGVELDRSTTAADLASLSLEHLLDLEISTASGFRQRMSSAPAVVRVIAADEIRAFGWTTLAEVLATLPGLYTSYDRSYTYLGARGFLRPGDYDSRFLLLVDGYRFNDPIYGQATIGREFPLDLEWVDRIEYVPGPGSALYGSNAFFGVINVITRRPKAGNQHVLSLQTGSAGLRAASGRFSHIGDDGSEFMVAASGRRHDGRDLYYAEFDQADSDGVARGLDGERDHRLLVKASWGEFDVSLLHGRRDKDTPTASFGQVFAVPGSFVVDEHTRVHLGHTRDLGSETRSSARFIYGHYAYWGHYLYEDAPIVVNHDGSEASWLGAEWKLVSSVINRHTLAVGVEAHHNLHLRQYNLDHDPHQVHLDDRRRGSRIGLFVEDEFLLRPGLLLNAGLRYDYDSTTGSDFSPRIALIKQGANSTYKLIAGQAFRSPNAYELYYQEDGGYAQLANVDLHPERIRTLEFAVSRRLGDYSSIDALIYSYRLSGLISQVEDEDSGLPVFRNLDQAQASGAEFALDHRRPDGLALRASFAYARVSTDDVHARPTNSPRRLVKLGASAPVIGGRALLGVQARHVGSRQGFDAVVPAYTVVDLNLTWPRIAERLEFQVSVNNVQDRRYFDPAGGEFRQNAIEQDGRNVRVKLSYRF